MNEVLESDDTYKKSDGKQPSYVVCAQSIGAAADVWCGIQWREIY